MPRLAKVLSGGRSQDIITEAAVPVAHEDNLEEEAKTKSGPVTTKLDLSQFYKFDGQKSQGQRGKWMSMGVRGEISISHEIGRTLPDDAKAEFFLNRKGTILVMRESVNGISLRKTRKSESRRAGCHALKIKMQELGIQFPARFVAEWDPELRAWVGRREG